MKNIAIVFLKEIKDVLRDRRTVTFMILMPLVLVPAILSVASYFMTQQRQEAMAQTIRVAITSEGNGERIIRRLKLRQDVELYPQQSKARYRELIREDSLDMAMIFSNTFDQQVAEGKSGEIEILYNSTSDSIIYASVMRTVNGYEKQLLNMRLDSLGATRELVNPIQTTWQDVYTARESVSKMVGGFLPYFFVMFCFFGAMYPAIDLFTGEKERGTLETLLTTPVKRIELLLGKLLVVSSSGIISGLLTITGLYVALHFSPNIPSFLGGMVNQILQPQVVALIILMLIPLTVSFAGLLIPASIFAKSFKEAMAIIQPLSFVVVIPLVIGMIPSVKLDMVTAFIPVLNIGLACREIVAQSISWPLLSIVFIYNVLLAGIGIWVSSYFFGREENILRL